MRVLQRYEEAIEGQESWRRWNGWELRTNAERNSLSRRRSKVSSWSCCLKTNNNGLRKSPLKERRVVKVFIDIAGDYKAVVTRCTTAKGPVVFSFLGGEVPQLSVEDRAFLDELAPKFLTAAGSTVTDR